MYIISPTGVIYIPVLSKVAHIRYKFSQSTFKINS